MLGIYSVWSGKYKERDQVRNNATIYTSIWWWFCGLQLLLFHIYTARGSAFWKTCDFFFSFFFTVPIAISRRRVLYLARTVFFFFFVILKTYYYIDHYLNKRWNVRTHKSLQCGANWESYVEVFLSYIEFLMSAREWSSFKFIFVHWQIMIKGIKLMVHV